MSNHLNSPRENEEKSTAAHQSAVERKADFYLNQQGQMVFTSYFHLRRGFCCGSGCRHCPYKDSLNPDCPQELQLANKQQQHHEHDEQSALQELAEKYLSLMDEKE